MTPFSEQRRDEYFMNLALKEAQKGAGVSGINPVVGCVIVSGGKVRGAGAYKGEGFPHAEIAAIRTARGLSDRSVLYVTLEPCCNFSKTPPCADAILRSGVKNVVIGCFDRNPAMSGKSVKILKKSGVHVKTGVLEKECVQLNRVFFKNVRTGLPYVTLKIAMTLDGKIAPGAGSRQGKTITSFASREQVHRLRREHDAVLTGAGTILSDNPHLTVRHVSLSSGKKLYRVVLDTRLRVPDSANIFRNQRHYPTLIATTKRSPEEKRERLRERGIDVVVFPQAKSGINVSRVLSYLRREKKIASVLVEGGTGLNRSFLEDGISDRVVIFVAPWFMSDERAVPAFRLRKKMKHFALKELVAKRVGADVCFDGEIAK